MTDEIILKLKDSIYKEDVIIAANQLIKKDTPEIIKFFENYGYPDLTAKQNGFYTHFIINTIVNFYNPTLDSKDIYSKVNIDNKMIWMGNHRWYFLKRDYFNDSEYDEWWKDETI